MRSSFLSVLFINSGFKRELILSLFVSSSCINGYLKDIAKCVFACPICKTQMNRRDLKTERKINNISEAFKGIKIKSFDNTTSFDIGSRTLSTRKCKKSDENVNLQSLKFKGLLESMNYSSGKSIKCRTKSKEKTVRSFEEFQDQNIFLTTKTLSSKAKRMKLLASGMPKEIMEEINKFSRLFKIKVLKEYKPSVTHLIVYPLKDKDQTIQAKRTLKYLNALIDGIWILSYRWIIDCILESTLKREDPYEVTEDSYSANGAKNSRIQGGLHSLLREQKFLIRDEWKEKEEKAIQKDDLQSIIENAGGRVVQETESFDIVVILTDHETTQKRSNKSKKLSVSHKWILDSISSAKLLEYEQYRV